MQYVSNLSHSKTLWRVTCDGNDYDILPMKDASGNLTVKEMEINSFVAQDGELRQVRIALWIPSRGHPNSDVLFRNVDQVFRPDSRARPFRDAPESSREPTS